MPIYTFPAQATFDVPADSPEQAAVIANAHSGTCADVHLPGALSSGLFRLTRQYAAADIVDTFSGRREKLYTFQAQGSFEVNAESEAQATQLANEHAGSGAEVHLRGQLQGGYFQLSRHYAAGDIRHVEPDPALEPESAP